MGGAATVAALLCAAGSLVLQAKDMHELAVSCLRVLAVFLLMAAAVILLMDRAVVAGGVFTWNNLDANAWSAFRTGAACAAFQLIGVILLVASGCMKQGAGR